MTVPEDDEIRYQRVLRCDDRPGIDYEVPRIPGFRTGRPGPASGPLDGARTKLAGRGGAALPKALPSRGEAAEDRNAAGSRDCTQKPGVQWSQDTSGSKTTAPSGQESPRTGRLRSSAEAHPAVIPVQPNVSYRDMLNSDHPGLCEADIFDLKALIAFQRSDNAGPQEAEKNDDFTNLRRAVSIVEPRENTGRLFLLQGPKHAGPGRNPGGGIFGGKGLTAELIGLQSLPPVLLADEEELEPELERGPEARRTVAHNWHPGTPSEVSHRVLAGEAGGRKGVSPILPRRRHLGYPGKPGAGQAHSLHSSGPGSLYLPRLGTKSPKVRGAGPRTGDAAKPLPSPLSNSARERSPPLLSLPKLFGQSFSESGGPAKEAAAEAAGST